MSKQLVNQISDKFAIINKDWLLTGEGSMLRQERAGVISVPASGINTEGRGAKVYDIDATCGSQGRDMDMTTDEQRTDVLRTLYLFSVRQENEEEIRYARGDYEELGKSEEI